MEKIRIEGKSQDEILEKLVNETQKEITDFFYIEKESEAKLFKAKKCWMEFIAKDDITAWIKDFLSTIATALCLDINTEIRMEEDVINILLISNDNAILIGKDGRTLNAMQLLLRQALHNQTAFPIRINLDVANYKSKKVKSLEQEIKKIAYEVLHSGIEVKLDSMNSYERRIVHNTVSEFSELMTESIGEEPERYVVIRKR